jgi:hypothetical protein
MKSFWISSNWSLDVSAVAVTNNIFQINYSVGSSGTLTTMTVQALLVNTATLADSEFFETYLVLDNSSSTTDIPTCSLTTQSP